MKRLLTSLAALAFLLSTTGCMTTLTGAGEMGVGYRSESTLFGYHTVDGDKEGKQAKSELDLDALMDLLLKWKEAYPGESKPDTPATP